jgi:HAD superfamily hydrolase (TIGR01509 family)
MGLTKLRGLFLDLDGTLANSLDIMREVYRSFMKKHSRLASDVEFDALNGPPLTEVVKSLAVIHHLESTPEELLVEYNSLIDDAYGAVSPSPNAKVLLKEARERGWRVGIVTSNNEKRTRDWLDNNGLANLVNFLVAGADVAHGKPAPDPYLLALERSGCVASLALAVEDSSQGAQSAISAGLRTFGYETGSSTTWPAGVHRITDLRQIIPQMAEKPTTYLNDV